MTPREAFRLVLRGGSSPAQVAFLLSGESPSAVALAKPTSERIGLAEIASPFARMDDASALLRQLQEDPAAGNATLDALVTDTAAEIETSLADGYDGILYRLEGPDPAHATPMQYGGFFLERDRAVLQSVPEGALRALWINAGTDAYLDFVSDLPADLFLWDHLQTGVSFEEVRAMRQGPIGTSDVRADVFFAATAADFSNLEPMTHV